MMGQAEQIVVPQQKLDASMKDDVTLLIFADEGTAAARELANFARSIAALSGRIKVDMQNAEGGKNQKMKELHIEHYPVVVLAKGDFARIRYYGVPSGYEMNPFVEAIAELSRSQTPLSPKAKAALATVRRKANIKIFVLTTCTFCPTVARHAYRAAVESQRVTSEIIDSQMFPDLAARHSVMGVPKIVLNDNLDMTGAVTDVEFFEKLRDSDHSLIDSMYG